MISSQPPIDLSAMMVQVRILGMLSQRLLKGRGQAGKDFLVHIGNRQRQKRLDAFGVRRRRLTVLHGEPDRLPGAGRDSTSIFVRETH